MNALIFHPQHYLLQKKNFSYVQTGRKWYFTKTINNLIVRDKSAVFFFFLNNLCVHQQTTDVTPLVQVPLLPCGLPPFL